MCDDAFMCDIPHDYKFTCDISYSYLDLSTYNCHVNASYKKKKNASYMYRMTCCMQQRMSYDAFMCDIPHDYEFMCDIPHSHPIVE